MATRTLTVNLVGRTDKLIRSFKNASKGADTMSGKLMRATRMASIGFGVMGGAVVGAAMAIKPMIDKAASLEESLSKNRLMFGEASKAVEHFAETAGHAFGVSERAALEATGIFGSLGNAMGMSEAASASMATTLTGLAGDLSSLHDVDVETALTALRAGLIGEAEPLRKLGILLDAATIKNKALAMGLVKNTKEALTPAIKSQAAYALILEKGARAMGDFTRTADSATNVTKQLAGQWVELQVTIGTMVLPAYTAFVTHLNDVIMPAVMDFFEDPSWERGAQTAGEAAMSGFVTGFAGFSLAAFGEFFHPGSFLARMGLNRLAEIFFGEGTKSGTALTRGFAAAIEQFGRDNPDWYRGDWDPEASGTADGLAYSGAFAAAAAADADMRREMQAALEAIPPFIPLPKIPGPGFPPDKPVVPPFVPGPKVPGPGFPFVPEPFTPGPKVPGPGFPPSGGGGGGFTMDPGQRGAINVTINTAAVTGSEVIDAMAAAVRESGPFSREWVQ